MAIYTRSSKCCPIRAEEGITGTLCPPNSATKFRDLPVDQQIGGYPAPGQLSDSVDEPTLDSEGRCVVLEFPAFVLIGVYSPANRDETRIEFREAYIDAIDVRVRNLVAMGKQVFLCGDLNIIRSEQDTAGLPERLRKEGMTIDDFFSNPSRRFLNHLVFGGHVVGERDEGRKEPILWDLCRDFHPTRAGMYTCWETRKNARPGNFGSRIDYVLCSSGIRDWFVDSNIQEGLLGSDHCPVYATIDDTVNAGGAKVCIEDAMNPASMFRDGERQREWSPKDLLPTSARLIPEFDRRRNIRDMFSKKATLSSKMGSKLATPTPQDTPHVADAALDKGNSNEPRKASVVSISQSSSQPAGLATGTNATTSTNITPTSLQKPPPLSKRQAESSISPKRPQKKGKATLSRDNSTKPTPGFAQSNLKGFFKPKTSTPDTTPTIESDSTVGMPTTPNKKPTEGSSKQRRGPSDPNGTPATKNDTQNTIEESPKPERFSPETVFDPIEAKESWSKLLGKRVLPRCEHGDECQTLVTKKPGVNCGMSFSSLIVLLVLPPLSSFVSPRKRIVAHPPLVSQPNVLCCRLLLLSRMSWLIPLVGRSFFMCARPLGPSGDKEQGTEFRCRTFIWSSDWNGR